MTALGFQDNKCILPYLSRKLCSQVSGTGGTSWPREWLQNEGYLSKIDWFYLLDFINLVSLDYRIKDLKSTLGGCGPTTATYLFFWLTIMTIQVDSCLLLLYIPLVLSTQL